MRCYPDNEQQLLDSFDREFRVFWTENSNKYSNIYDNWDHSFGNFLKTIFNLWDNDLIK